MQFVLCNTAQSSTQPPIALRPCRALAARTSLRVDGSVANVPAHAVIAGVQLLEHALVLEHGEAAAYFAGLGPNYLSEMSS